MKTEPLKPAHITISMMILTCVAAFEGVYKFTKCNIQPKDVTRVGQMCPILCHPSKANFHGSPSSAADPPVHFTHSL